MCAWMYAKRKAGKVCDVEGGVMSVDLERLAELCEKATPGPWETDGQGGVTSGLHWVVSEGDTEDCDFIAAARDAVPELIHEVADANESLAACQSEAAGRITELEDKLHDTQCDLEAARDYREEMLSKRLPGELTDHEP